MKDIIFYELLNMDLIRKGFSDNRISELLQSWLSKNGLDVLVSIFDIGDNHVSLNLDYLFSDTKDVEKIKRLTEMFLDKMHIEYKLEVQ